LARNWFSNSAMRCGLTRLLPSFSCCPPQPTLATQIAAIRHTTDHRIDYLPGRCGGPPVSIGGK
jgi:hypothetical protein